MFQPSWFTTWIRFNCVNTTLRPTLKGGQGTAITADHTAEKSQSEAERLKDMGIEVRQGYLAGQLAVSRAFGDLDLKTKSKVPGLLALPDVFKVHIGEDTEFLLLGSDGIFDPLQDRHAATHARKALRETQRAEAAALAVIENAGALSTLDNSSAAVIVLRMPEPLAKRAPRSRASLSALGS